MIKKRMSFAPVCAAIVLALAGATGCSEIQQAIGEGAQAGEAQGSMAVLGRFAVEQSAGVKLTGDLDCTTGEPSGTDTPIDCSGQTADGRKASLKGTVTSADPDKGVVKGKFTLTFDGKSLGEVDCVGVC